MSSKTSQCQLICHHKHKIQLHNVGQSNISIPLQNQRKDVFCTCVRTQRLTNINKTGVFTKKRDKRLGGKRKWAYLCSVKNKEHPAEVCQTKDFDLLRQSRGTERRQERKEGGSTDKGRLSKKTRKERDHYEFHVNPLGHCGDTFRHQMVTQDTPRSTEQTKKGTPKARTNVTRRPHQER